MPNSEPAFDESKHGTEYRYVRYRCRCDECKKAANDARARRRMKPNPKVHGETAQKNGCPCDVCREAHRVGVAKRRKVAS